MGNNAGVHEQWSPDPGKPEYATCNAMQPAWPRKVCNRPAGHTGEHCERRQAGTVMVETWWK